MSSESPGSELRRLRALVSDLDAVVWEAEASSGRFTFISEAATETLGYPPKTFLNAPSFWADHIHPDDREAAVKEFLAGIEEGRPHDAEYRFLKPRGDVVWLRDIGHAVTDVAGRPLTIRGLMVDITQSKLAEERRAEVEQRYRRLVRQIPGIAYIEEADPSHPGPGRTTFVSQAVERILGYTVQEWLSEPAGWVDRLHPADVPGLRAAYEATVPSGERFSAEYRIRAADGHIVWIHDEAVLVRDEVGVPLYWQGVMFDVSEQRIADQRAADAEEKSRSLVDQLSAVPHTESLLRQERLHADELERALHAEREEAEKLRALDELKNTFLQAVSHDLRTPLAAILGLAVTLERQETIDAEEARDLASRIAANARRLDRIVTDLLDLDRITRGIVVPKRKRTDVGALVRRVLAETDLAADRVIELDTRRAVAAVDAAKVERIVENLLSNAVRHTPAGSHIWIRTATQDDGVLLAVEDDGPGVPPEQRADIFEPFRQGADVPEHAPGVGIGLTLVARFAEMHGGRAWVQDRDGGGASFRVWLPSAGPEPG